MVCNVLKLNNFLVKIHTFAKHTNSFKPYVCKLYFRKKIIVSDTVFTKTIECEADMEKIAVLFLDKVFKKNTDIENIYRTNEIVSKEGFFKLINKHLKRKEYMQKLNKDQVDAIQSWVRNHNA